MRGAPSAPPEPCRDKHATPHPANPTLRATSHLRRHHTQHCPLQLRKLRPSMQELPKATVFQEGLDLGPRRAPFRGSDLHSPL